MLYSKQSKESEGTFMSKEYTIINEKVYDDSVDQYRQKRSDSRNIALTEREVHPFIQYQKNLDNQGRILEVGPGVGLALCILYSEGFKLTAIDISQKMINASKEVCQDCDYIKGNFLEYDFKDLQFEGIFANRVIHMFPRDDAIKFLKKAKGLLTKGGLIGITTNLVEKSYDTPLDNEKNADSLLYSDRFRRFWEEKDLLDAIKSAELDLIYHEYYPYYIDDASIIGINLGLN